MLHGFMGTAESHFINQISFLKSDFELILLDLPGHGNSKEVASDNYFEDTLDWVVSKIKSKGKGFILGLSLGASLAIHIAKREPDLVNGIVLTGYSTFIPTEFKEVMEKQYKYFIHIEENDKNIATHFQHVHGERWFDTLKKVLYTMTFNYPTISNKELRNLNTPILVLNGSKDIYEVEAATHIKKQNSNIEIGIVPGGGHTVNIDQPKTYNTLVREFFYNLI